MADKNYVSNKEKKEIEQKKQKQKNSYKSPTKTIWGKALILILVFGMIVTPFIFLIVCFIQN